MVSFPEESLYVLGDSRYCERCFQVVVDEGAKGPEVGPKSPPPLTQAPPPSPRVFRIVAATVLAAGVLCGGILGAQWVLRHRPLPAFEALPAFRPVKSAKGAATAEPSKTRNGAALIASAAASEPVIVPVAKGSNLITCPVCDREQTRSPHAQKMICPQCSRLLVLKEYDLLPHVQYIARTRDSALLRLIDQERWVKVGEEVQPGTGIFLDRFTRDGVLFTKTESLSLIDHRTSPPRKMQKQVHLEQGIAKYRDDETTSLALVQGTPSITCDGQGKERVYHTSPVQIKMDTKETNRILVVPCPLAECWKQFEVVVRPAPPIALTVSPNMDEVPCPVCGFVRQLTAVGSGDSFVCLKCRRSVVLAVAPLGQIRYLGREDGAARIVGTGDDPKPPSLVQPGKEIWPGAGITFVGFREDGAAKFRKEQTVVFSDYQTTPPTEHKVQRPIVWTLEKSAKNP